MNEVATTEATSIMQVIERMAMNPAVDLDKLKGLLDLQERIMGKQAEQAYDEAMNAAQEEMLPIAKDAASDKGKYASYAALDRAIRPIYTKHGFSLSFDTGEAPTDYVRIVCRIGHRAGHRERPHLDMPADGKGAKGGDVMTKTHATGSAITYGKRYMLGMIFNVAIGEDDDGARAGRTQTTAVEAAVTAINACNDASDMAMWKRNNAKGMELLSAGEQDQIVRHFNLRAKRMKGGDGE